MILLVPILFKHLKLPGLVGLILAGVVLGPDSLGLIREGSFVQPFGAVGLLYLMFLAGLEVDMHRFQREKRNSITFGGITFLIPQVAGMLGALWLLGLSWPASILLASMFASHTLLPYPIVQRLGLVKEKVVTAAVGGTVLTDSLAFLVLAVVAESVRGDLTTAFWIRLAVLFLAYVGLVIWSVPKLGRWFFRRVPAESIAGFLFVLAFAYMCSATAPLAGLEPIIGAFLAGLTLNMLIPEQSRLMIRLRFVGEALFIPLFLISVGLRVNVRLLAGSGEAWLVMGYMVAAGFVTKFLAALLSGKILRFSGDETGVLFGLSVNQAAATLAAVIVGQRIGIFTEDILNGTILMILATCMLGPWVTERYGRKLAMSLSGSHLDSSGAPERILVPICRTEQIEPMMSLALLVRSARFGQPLYPAMITGEDSDTEEAVARAEKILGEAVVLAVEADTPVQPVTRVAPSVIEGLMGVSRDLRISTVIMDEDYAAVSEFEHIPNLLVEQGRHLVLRFRNPAPINTCRRFLVTVPPLMERQPGFPAAWQVLQRLATQSGSRLMVTAVPATMKALTGRQMVRALDPNTTLNTVKNWHDIPGVIRNVFRDGDLPVLFLARTGRLAWQPVQARLPGLLDRALGHPPLLMLYPPEMKWETGGAPTLPEGDFQGVFPPESVFLRMKEPDIGGAVETMISAVYPDSTPLRDSLMEDCFMQQREAALWLSPECLLLHTHRAYPPAPMALLATSRKGFGTSREEESAKALVLLLGTPEESAEEHLRRLARIASLFHEKDLLERITTAERYECILSAGAAGKHFNGEDVPGGKNEQT